MTDSQSDPTTPSDASPPDAGPSDASPSDASPTDASLSDASPSDASPSDAGDRDGASARPNEPEPTRASASGDDGTAGPNAATHPPKSEDDQPESSFEAQHRQPEPDDGGPHVEAASTDDTRVPSTQDLTHAAAATANAWSPDEVGAPGAATDNTPDDTSETSHIPVDVASTETIVGGRLSNRFEATADGSDGPPPPGGPPNPRPDDAVGRAPDEPGPGSAPGPTGGGRWSTRTAVGVAAAAAGLVALGAIGMAAVDELNEHDSVDVRSDGHGRADRPTPHDDRRTGRSRIPSRAGRKSEDAGGSRDRLDDGTDATTDDDNSGRRRHDSGGHDSGGHDSGGHDSGGRARGG